MDTVKVRIALAVDGEGKWYAIGGSGLDDSEAMDQATDVVDFGEARYFVTVEAALPETRLIKGEIEAAAGAGRE